MRPADGERVPSVEAARRCDWAVSDLAIAYHDREWGAPCHGDRTLFELLVLEGAQAGLSWETILGKRERYREVFDHFDPAAVARYDGRRVRKLLSDPGIVRNRLKVRSAIDNAKAFRAVQREFGSFDRYLWAFVDGRPVTNRRRRVAELPARTRLSDALSADLRRRGFSFVGSTICYAYLQAVGLVNDHLVTCFRHTEVSSPRGGARRPRHSFGPAPSRHR